MSKVLEFKEHMSEILDCATCYDNVMATSCSYDKSITTNKIIEVIESFLVYTVTRVMVITTDFLRPTIYIQVNNKGYISISPFTISNVNRHDIMSIQTDSLQYYSWEKFKSMNKVDKKVNLLKARL